MEIERDFLSVGTMHSQPLLSVVVPAYRSSRFIFYALNSLRKSALPLQVIVVENGSSEIVEEELARALAPHDLYFSTLEQADLSSARNLGLSLAKGKWILFLDSDDWVNIDVYLQLVSDDLADNCSVLRVEMLEEKTPGATSANNYGKRGKGGLTQQGGPEYLLSALIRHQYSPVTGCYLFRRIDIERWGLRFAPGFIHEDHAFTASAILKSQCLLSSKTIGLHKLTRADSLSHTATPAESIRGYAHAISEIEGLSKPDDFQAPLATVAHALLLRRLKFILAKKRLSKNPHCSPTNVTTRSRSLGSYAGYYARGAVSMVIQKVLSGATGRGQ